jgi:chromosomal replication initiation ATPase DnaA
MNYQVIPGVPKIDLSVKVIDAASLHFHCDLDYFRQQTNIRSVTEPRQILMYLLRMEANIPFMRIGKILGFHHSTVIKSVERIEDRLSINDEFTVNSVNSIRRTIRL